MSVALNQEFDAPVHFGRYEIVALIAQGGMGTVYLCRVAGKDGFRRLFAVKFVHPHLSRNEEFVRMLSQEARIASRLHHPNIVGIVDIGSHDATPYLVMDYVEGCTFAQLLRRHRADRPLRLTTPILLDALNGLHAAHSLVDDDGSPLQLVHRDFSPQNLLIGADGTCRISDFGVAKAAGALTQTTPGTVRGKPAYMSPEQISGGLVDHRSDVFAAGVVLWNALTGKRLFDGATPHATMYNVLRRDPPPPSTIGLQPPNYFDKICLRALQRKPGRRFQSAEAMLNELRKVAISHDLLAPSSEVAAWVNQTFGAELEQRRERLRDAPTGTSVSVPRLSGSSLSLPALRIVGPQQTPLSSPSLERELLTWQEMSDGSAHRAGLQEGNADALSDAEIKRSRGRRSKRLWPWVAVATLAAGALVVVGVQAMTPSGSAPALDVGTPAPVMAPASTAASAQETVAVPKATAVPARQALPTTPASAPEAPSQAELPEAQVPAPTITTNPPLSTPTPRSRRRPSRRRAPTPSPTPAAPPAAPPSTSAPAPGSSSPQTPAPTAVERNPYLQAG